MALPIASCTAASSSSHRAPAGNGHSTSKASPLGVDADTTDTFQCSAQLGQSLCSSRTLQQDAAHPQPTVCSAYAGTDQSRLRAACKSSPDCQSCHEEGSPVAIRWVLPSSSPCSPGLAISCFGGRSRCPISSTRHAAGAAFGAVEKHTAMPLGTPLRVQYAARGQEQGFFSQCAVPPGHAGDEGGGVSYSAPSLSNMYATYQVGSRTLQTWWRTSKHPSPCPNATCLAF